MTTCLLSQSNCAIPIGFRTLEIVWHTSEDKDRRNEPIMSVDFHPTLMRMVTAGSNGRINIWNLNAEILRAAALEPRSSMELVTQSCKLMAEVVDADGRGQAVNCARWSPSGNFIGAVYDDGYIVIWKQTDRSSTAIEADNLNLEHWASLRTFRNITDLYDISFSPTSQYVVVGGIKGGVTVYDLETGLLVQDFPEIHDKRCQGVSWDPLNEYVISAGADRCLRVFCIQQSKRNPLSSSHSIGKHNKQVCSFFGECASPFFRRMTWSPDGLILVTPLGHWRSGAGEEEAQDPEMENCVYCFLRNNMSQPAMALGVKGNSAIVGAKFAPCFFTPLPATASADSKGSWGPDAYRMALAVWTDESVVVFTTDCSARFCSFSDIHYDRITDVTWSHDATFLMISSLDGYISTACFNRPIGEIYPLFSVPTEVTMMMMTAPIVTDEADVQKINEQNSTINISKEEKNAPAAEQVNPLIVLGLQKLFLPIRQQRMQREKVLLEGSTTNIVQGKARKKKKLEETVSAPVVAPTTTAAAVDELEALLDDDPSALLTNDSAITKEIQPIEEVPVEPETV